MPRLDPTVSRRVLRLLNKVAQYDDPRDGAEALIGDLAGLWRYRVGDYRVIVEVTDAVLTILVIEVGHRREVYR